MITWTPEAERVIYDYLNEVARLAAIRGEDAEELHANLMDHIRTEVAERGLDLVTEDIAKQITAQLGAPEDIVGEGTAAATSPASPQASATPPPQPAPAPPQKQGMRWFSPPGCLIATIIGLVFAFVVVPVIGILAAIAIPAISRAKLHAEMAEQEAQVLATLEYIVEAEEAFKEAALMDRNNDGVSDYGSIEDLNAWIDGKTIPYEAYGYKFDIDVRYGDENTEPEFHCRADPFDPSVPPGRKKFYVNQNRVVRYAQGAEVPGEYSEPLKTIRDDGDNESEPTAKTQHIP